MRLICISDTHSLHTRMPAVPDGDVLIHAGDCTGSGSLPQLDEFTQWFASFPHKRKILISGNHDFCFQRYPEWSREMCERKDICYLDDEAIDLDGLRFFGSAWTPIYRPMAFTAFESEMFEHRAKIFEDTEVLITHGPPLGIFDYVPRDDVHVGCFPLKKRISELTKLKAHVFGHIHESYGFARREVDNIAFANVSICNGHYEPVNLPIIIDV